MQQQTRSIQAPLSRSTSDGRRKFGPSRLTDEDGFLLRTLVVIAFVAALGLFVTVRQQMAVSRPLQSSQQFRMPPGGREVPHVAEGLHDALKSAEAGLPEGVDPAPGDPSVNTDNKEILVLRTKIGSIRIVLRPDLSKESVEYIRRVMEASDSEGSCPGCRLYRAEQPDILQGALREDVAANTVKGACPTGFEDVPNDCPEWDPQCGCHGPIMTKGMVGWAAGTAGGPDFFITNHDGGPAEWWGTQHTVWGEVQDGASFAVIDHVWTMPTEEQDGLTFLVEPLEFTIEMA